MPSDFDQMHPIHNNGVVQYFENHGKKINKEKKNDVLFFGC